MKDHIDVLEGRVQQDGSVRYLVQGLGGVIIVYQDPAGSLSARIRSGYVLKDETEEEVIARALDAVRGLHQDSSPSHEPE